MNAPGKTLIATSRPSLVSWATVDAAHPAAPDERRDLERSESRSGEDVVGRHRPGRPSVNEIEQSGSIDRLIEEVLDFPPHVVVWAGFGEKGGAVARARRRRLEQVLDPLPASRIHG